MVQLGTVSHNAVYFAENPIRHGSVEYPAGPDKQTRFSAVAGLRGNSVRERRLTRPAQASDLDGLDGGLAKSKSLYGVEGDHRQLSDPDLFEGFIFAASGVFSEPGCSSVYTHGEIYLNS
jgi:hypothetical protein